MDKEPNPARRSARTPVASAVLSNKVAAGIVFLAAAAVLVLEIVALRLVGPYVGITLTNSTAVIGVSLGAIAYGAWTGGALADRIDPHKLLPPVFGLSAAATALTLPLVRWTGEVLRGTGLFGVVVLAALAVFVPAALLSAITPVVVKLQLADMKHTGRVVGRLSSIGTLGGITATFVTGFVLVAALPTSTILLVLALVLAAVGAALWWRLAGPASPSWQGVGSWLRRPGGAAGVVVLVLAGTGVTAAVPTPCDTETAYQCARVEVDPERPGGRTLWLNTGRHSYVDLNDFTYLQFAYTQWLGKVVDQLAPPGEPIRVLHLGGGGFTMPRYVTATRPGSDNRVLELDGQLVELGKEQLGVVEGPDLSIVVGDARASLLDEPSGSYDLVVGDAFGHLAVPWHLTTREFVTDIRRVLRPGGVYALNVIDYPPDLLIRAEVATVMDVFEHVVLIAPEAAYNGTTGSNFLIVASTTPLLEDSLRVAVATVARPASLFNRQSLERFAGDAQILTDDFAPVDQLMGRP